MKSQQNADEAPKRFPKIMSPGKSDEGFLPAYVGQRKNAKTEATITGMNKGVPMEFGLECLAPSAIRIAQNPDHIAGPDPSWLLPRKNNVAKPRQKTERDHVKES